MRRFLQIVCVVLALSSPSFAGDEGRVSLFDGKSLDGWTHKNGYATFVVEDGAIVGRTAAGSPNSFLCTTKDYGDFELEFETRVDVGLNSGVQIRSSTKKVATGKGPNNAVGRVFGPQVEIVTGPGDAGYLYGEATGRGWLRPKAQMTRHDKFKNDGWNKYRVVARGPRIQTYLNGEPIEDLTDEAIYREHPSGFIGLQVHSVPMPLEVRWRNLRIRELTGAAPPLGGGNGPTPSEPAP